MTDEEIEKMVLKADSDDDGLLTVDDFYSVLVNMNANYEWGLINAYFICMYWLIKIMSKKHKWKVNNGKVNDREKIENV